MKTLRKSTVGDFLLERLAQWGVRRIYGYPGDGINGSEKEWWDGVKPRR